MMIYHGEACSDGIGIGKAVVVREYDLDVSQASYTSEAEEKQRLLDAIRQFCEKTLQMAEKMAARVGKQEADILSGQTVMLNDPFMIDQMNDQIAQGKTAEQALDLVCGMYIEMFSAVEDELTRQRATDIRDIRTRTLKILMGISETDLSDLPPDSVIIAKDFTPSMTSQMNHDHVAAIVTEIGGRTSHSAILARAMEIPAVLGAQRTAEEIPDGALVAVNGMTGEIFVEPDEPRLTELSRLRDDFLQNKKNLEQLIGKPTQTADCVRVQLYGNIGRPAEVKSVLSHDGEGIGLFRTEFLFMDRPALPSEEEQYEAYAQVVREMDGKEVIIRTLDVGGDKEIPYLQMEREDNPFLGHRAIRYGLERTDLYSVQLRALLRAGVHGNLKIMLPLVTGVQEIRAAKELIARLKEDLKREGVPYGEDIPVGVMIETPAAALTADLMAREADFFSIGTNDLTQYTMAADRGNAKVKNLCSPYSPGVLRAIQMTIQAANAAKIPVGMCGEAAADPLLIPLLISFGLDEYSVSPASILEVRRQISRWTKAAADELAARAMSLSTAEEIKNLLKNA